VLNISVDFISLHLDFNVKLLQQSRKFDLYLPLVDNFAREARAVRLAHAPVARRGTAHAYT
jgi:hypothetical protein